MNLSGLIKPILLIVGKPTLTTSCLQSVPHNLNEPQKIENVKLYENSLPLCVHH